MLFSFGPNRATNAKHLFTLAIAALLLALHPCMAQPQAIPMEEMALQYQYQLPAGTAIPIVLQEDVSTETSILGQPISAFVSQDVYVGTQKVLSRADRVLGRVIQIDPPMKGRNAMLKVEFDVLSLSNGVKLPLLTWVETGQEGRYWGGETTPGTKPVIIPYNVYRIGTYGRVMYHGERAMGEHVTLKPGTRIMLVLTQPLQLVVF